MTKKRWILVGFDSCPNCGDDAEILTDNNEKDQFFDGDEVRCCQQCGSAGFFSVDGYGEGYINWGG